MNNSKSNMLYFFIGALTVVCFECLALGAYTSSLASLTASIIAAIAVAVLLLIVQQQQPQPGHGKKTTPKPSSKHASKKQKSKSARKVHAKLTVDTDVYEEPVIGTFSFNQSQKGRTYYYVTFRPYNKADQPQRTYGIKKSLLESKFVSSYPQYGSQIKLTKARQARKGDGKPFFVDAQSITEVSIDGEQEQEQDFNSFQSGDGVLCPNAWGPETAQSSLPSSLPSSATMVATMVPTVQGQNDG